MCAGSSDQRGIPRSISATARWPYRPRKPASPDCTTAGSPPSLYRRASSGGEASSKIAAATGWARMSVASCHRARSISVVTLLGSPRRTACNAPDSPPCPASFPATARSAKPRAGSGSTAGTMGKSPSLRIRSAWFSRSAGVAVAGTTRAARCRAPKASTRRIAASGRSSARSSDSGTFALAATGTTRRRSRQGDLMVTENCGSANSLRSTVADLASMMSKTRGTMARPTLLRTTGVRSTKRRCPACR
ncbi:hypothetical protein D9M72_441550 [compost metagenome]